MTFLIFAFALFAQSHLAFANTPLSEDCKEYLASLPAETFKGWISVPEDWSNLRSKKIKVFYYGFNIKENPGVSPLAYFNGGPGAAAHGMEDYLADKEHYPKVPFLFIDQRGTGCSDPFPAIEYTKAGVQKTALYGARSIVMDAEAIRHQVFGGIKWRIFGQSYGSFIVHRYLEIAPAGLTAAFAHGFSLMSDSIAWTENRTRVFKRVGDLYFKQYPEDRAIILRAHTLFPKNYCVHSTDADVCGSALLDVLGWNGLSFPDFNGWINLHNRIQKLLLPTGELDMSYIRRLFPQELTPADPASFLIDVVPAREAPGGFSNTWSCELAIPQMENKGENPMQYEFNECRIGLATKRHFDYKIVRDVIAEDYSSLKKIHFNLKTHPRLKFFLYSGEIDTFGPAENATEEVKLFGKRVTYRAYSSGHGSYFAEPQTWKDILSTQ